MINPAHDGRIVLCKNTLKSLRRNIGSSQEKMAFLCAEQGLCVSVASIKRAETSKNVLYRTARDIARFYDVELSELLDTNAASPSDFNPLKTYTTDTPAQERRSSNQSSALNITIKRNFVLLIFKFNAERLSTIQQAKIAAGINALINQYEAVKYSLKNTSEGKYSEKNSHHRTYFTFGSSSTQGNEIQRALHFSFNSLKLIKSISVKNTTANILLSCCETDDLIFHKEIHNTLTAISPKHQQQADIIFKQAPSNSVYIFDDLKGSIRENFNYQLVTEAISGQKIWQVIDPYENNDFNGPPYSTNNSSTCNFVGRKVEMMQFQAVLESAVEYNSTQLVYLMGPAGIGKSRLLSEYCRDIIKDNFTTHSVAIFNYHVEQKQQAIPQLIQSLLNITADSNPLSFEEIVKKTHFKWISESKHLPILYSLLNWPTPKPWTALLEAMTSERLFTAQHELIASIIKTKIKNNSQVLIFEDYHWADKNLRCHINKLISDLDSFPLVFLFTSRPSDTLSSLISENEAAGKANTIINLSPLSQKDATNLANSFSNIAPVYRQKCINKAQGNPLFLEQLLKDKHQTFDSSLPFSLQSLISARIDNMNQIDQFAIRAAAVIGPQFSLDLLRKLTEDPLYSASPLIHANIIHHTDNGYAFNHALIMEGIYLSLSEHDRNKLHYACSQWFHEDIVLQCHHLLKAKHPSAEKKIIPATNQLLQGFKFEQAKELINVGLKKYNNSNADILADLYEINADVNYRLGEIQQALKSYQDQLNHCSSPEKKADALIGIANCFNTLDQPEDAHSALDTAHQIAIEHDYVLALSRIYYLNGNFLFPKGKVEECFEHQKKSLHFARQANNIEMEARALGGLGDAAYAKGKMSSAHNYFSRCLGLCHQHDLKQVSAANLFMLGTVSIYHNQTQSALSVTEESILTADLVGHKRAKIVSHLTAGWILLDWLRLDEALEHIDTGLEIAKEIGAKRFVPFLLESKARYYFSYSEKDKALACIDTAIKEVNELDAHTFIGPWLLGTRATFTDDWRSAYQFLKSGVSFLEQGAIGHNHYRFYVAAIETSIKHRQYKHTLKYIDQLKKFTCNEETPWSNFYIHRAEFILKHIDSKINIDKPELNRLIDTAHKAKLLTALPALEDAFCDAPTL